MTIHKCLSLEGHTDCSPLLFPLEWVDPYYCPHLEGYKSTYNNYESAVLGLIPQYFNTDVTLKMLIQHIQGLRNAT